MAPAQSMDKVRKKYETASGRQPKVWNKYRQSMKRRQCAGPKYEHFIPKVWDKYRTNMKLQQGAGPKCGQSFEQV